MPRSPRSDVPPDSLRLEHDCHRLRSRRRSQARSHHRVQFEPDPVSIRVAKIKCDLRETRLRTIALVPPVPACHIRLATFVGTETNNGKFLVEGRRGRSLALPFMLLRAHSGPLSGPRSSICSLTLLNDLALRAPGRRDIVQTNTSRRHRTEPRAQSRRPCAIVFSSVVTSNDALGAPAKPYQRWPYRVYGTETPGRSRASPPKIRTTGSESRAMFVGAIRNK